MGSSDRRSGRGRHQPAPIAPPRVRPESPTVTRTTTGWLEESPLDEGSDPPPSRFRDRPHGYKREGGVVCGASCAWLSALEQLLATVVAMPEPGELRERAGHSSTARSWSPGDCVRDALDAGPYTALRRGRAERIRPDGRFRTHERRVAAGIRDWGGSGWHARSCHDGRFAVSALDRGMSDLVTTCEVRMR